MSLKKADPEESDSVILKAAPEESDSVVLNVVKNPIGDRHKILRFARSFAYAQHDTRESKV